MATENPQRSTLLVRTAVWIGGAFGRWQRNRAAARDDSFVERWKAAWNEGCAAYQSGVSDRQVPYSRAPQKEAWLAGWAWAKQQRQQERR